METKRKKNLNKARTLQILNVIYDVIEVMVSLFAGITANSSALIGWALDSTIEVKVRLPWDGDYTESFRA